MTLLLPIGTVADEPYLDLFEHRWAPDRTTNAALDVVETERGTMLEVRIDQLDQRLDGSREANVIFMNRWKAPRSRTMLMPRTEAVEVDEGFAEVGGEPEQVKSMKTIERFTTAVAVSSERPHDVTLRLENRTDSKHALNFGVFRWKTFSESFEIETAPNGEWTFPRVEVVRSVSIDRPFD